MNNGYDARVGFCRVVLQADPSLVPVDELEDAYQFWLDEERRRDEREQLYVALIMRTLGAKNALDFLPAAKALVKRSQQSKRMQESTDVPTSEQMDALLKIFEGGV